MSDILTEIVAHKKTEVGGTQGAALVGASGCRRARRLAHPRLL